MDNQKCPVLQLQSDINNFTEKLKQQKVNELLGMRLEQLANDILEKPDKWLSVDVYKTFDPAILVGNSQTYHQKRAWWINLIEIIRNALVLVPILFTWFALSNASISYVEAIKADPSLAEQPFLIQWEDGFAGNITNIFGYTLTFSNVALLDSALIFLIILLTVIVMFLGNYHVEQVNRQVLELEAELQNLLWRINNILNEYRQTEIIDSEKRSRNLLNGIAEFVAEFQAHSHELENNIAMENQRLSVLAEFRQKEIDDLQRFSSDLKNITKDFTPFGQSLLNTLQEFKGITHSFTNEFASFSESQISLAGSIQSIQSHLAGLEKVITQLQQIQDRVISELLNSIQLNTIQSQELTQQVNRLSAVAREMGESQTSLQNTLSDEITANDKWVGSIHQSMGQVTTIVQAIDQFQQKLNSSTDQFIALSQTNETIASNLQNLAKEILNLRSAIDVDRKTNETLANSVLDIARKLSSLERPISSMLNSLTAVSNELPKLREAFSSESPKKGLFERMFPR